jgi:hypothetical protein
LLGAFPGHVLNCLVLQVVKKRGGRYIVTHFASCASGLSTARALYRRW